MRLSIVMVMMGQLCVEGVSCERLTVCGGCCVAGVRAGGMILGWGLKLGSLWSDVPLQM